MAGNMRRQDYTVGIICALPLELTAVCAMLNEFHDTLPNREYDTNTYNYGRMGNHHVVVACLPSGVYGTNSAARIANQLMSSFPNIRYGLMVGIAGGVPHNDVRLGDVVVSRPAGTYGGVIQYDLVKTIPSDNSEPIHAITGHLNKPPDELLTAIGNIASQDMLHGGRLSQYLLEAYQNHPKFHENFSRPSPKSDILFNAGYEHVPDDSHDRDGNQPCKNCDDTYLMSRSPREDRDPHVHYGLIGSGNQLMRHGRTRDKIAKELGVLCFEMEAAGFMGDFLVIRGICDYADSHKNKFWQKYAAAVAAAFSRQLLETVPKVENHSNPTELRGVQDVKDCQKSLYFPEYDYRRSFIENAEHGTCSWILDHSVFKQWITNDEGLLWIKGKPGAGKSTLMKFIVAHMTSTNTKLSPLMLSFFFDGGGTTLQKTPSGHFRSFLYQILDKYPGSCPDIIGAFVARVETAGEAGKHWNWNDGELRDFLKRAIFKVLESRPVHAFVDALDECGEENAIKLAAYLHSLISTAPNTPHKLRICFSCRHYPIVDQFPGLCILVEDENSQDIQTFVQSQLRFHRLTDKLEPLILRKASGVFQWVALVINRLARLRRKGYNMKHLYAELERTPPELHELYRNILGSLQDVHERNQTLRLMEWVYLAAVPLDVHDLYKAMIVDDSSSNIASEDLMEADDVENTGERIIDISCGLVEITPENLVRFIHQSVLDFLLKGGFNILSNCWFDIDTAIDQAHYRFTICCLRYIEMIDPPAEVDRNWMFEQKFLVYALTNWDYHAREAITLGASLAEEILDAFGWPHLSSFNKYVALCKGTFTSKGGLFPNFNSKGIRSSASTPFLHHLAKSCLFDALKLALERLDQADLTVDAEDDQGYTALSWAALDGHNDIVQLLLERHDVNVNRRGGDLNMSPLMLATWEGNFTTIELLLKRNDIVVNAVNGTGFSALSFALSKRHWPAVKSLLRSDKLDTQSIHFPVYRIWKEAIKMGQQSVIELLLDLRPADARRKVRLNGEIFLLAVRECQDTIVRTLLEHIDCPVNSQDFIGRTPIFLAVEFGQLAMIKTLLRQRDIDLDKTDMRGFTPLVMAILKGHYQSVKLLIESGRVDINLGPKFVPGSTPLAEAIRCGRSRAVVELLKSHGARISTESDEETSDSAAT